MTFSGVDCTDMAVIWYCDGYYGGQNIIIEVIFMALVSKDFRDSIASKPEVLLHQHKSMDCLRLEPRMLQGNCVPPTRKDTLYSNSRPFEK